MCLLLTNVLSSYFDPSCLCHSATAFIFFIFGLICCCTFTHWSLHWVHPLASEHIFAIRHWFTFSCFFSFSSNLHYHYLLFFFYYDPQRMGSHCAPNYTSSTHSFWYTQTHRTTQYWITNHRWHVYGDRILALKWQDRDSVLHRKPYLPQRMRSAILNL